MPIIRRRPPQPPPTEELIDELQQELLNPASGGLPLILENAVGDTDNFNVYVIWDRWIGLSQAHRQRVIRSTYQRLHPTEWEKVPVAMGLTFREAIDQGVLPIRIVQNLRRSESHLPLQLAEELRMAMLNEGAVELTDGRVELRFPTRDDASEVFQRLAHRFPGRVRIIEEVPQGEEWLD